MDVDGYLLYRRKNNINHGYEPCNLLVNNQNVAPYNPFLFRKYGRHINIKVCGSIHVVNIYIYNRHNHIIMQFGCEPNEGLTIF